MSDLLPARRAAAARAFTLIELLVVIAIIAILAAILFPVFAQARARARQAACLSNTRQMALALLQYAQDYDDGLPTVGNTGAKIRWMAKLYPYIQNAQVFDCPELGNVGYVDPSIAKGKVSNDWTSYGWNYDLAWDPANNINGWILPQIPHPSETIVIGDSGYVWNNVQQAAFAMYGIDPRNIPAGGSVSIVIGQIVQFRHLAGTTRQATFAVNQAAGGNTTARCQFRVDGMANFTFLDGHSRAMNPGQAFQIVPQVNGVYTEDGSPALAPPAGSPVPGVTSQPTVYYKYWNAY